jgi:hypothetical protein
MERSPLERSFETASAHHLNVSAKSISVGVLAGRGLRLRWGMGLAHDSDR